MLDFDAQEAWRTRAYFVEIKFPVIVPDSLQLEATASLAGATGLPAMPVARTLASLQPRTASRPTRLVLTPLKGGTGDDMGLPDLAGSPVDLSGRDMASPPFVWTNVTPATAPAKLFAISGIPSGTMPIIYAIGATATIVKSSGGSTFAPAIGPTTASSDFNALWVQNPNSVWIGDSAGKVFVSTDGAATAVGWADKMAGSALPWRALAGSSARDSLYAGGDDTSKALVLSPLSSTTWSASSASCAQANPILGIWAGPSYTLFAGQGFKLAKTQNPLMGCTALAGMGFSGSPKVTALHGVSDTAAFAVTSDGQLGMTDLTALNDKIFRLASISGAAFSGVWARSATEVWISASGKVYQWDGTSISDRTGTLPAGYAWAGIWGDGNGSLWVVGSLGTTGAIYKH